MNHVTRVGIQGHHTFVHLFIRGVIIIVTTMTLNTISRVGRYKQSTIKSHHSQLEGS